MNSLQLLKYLFFNSMALFVATMMTLVVAFLALAAAAVTVVTSVQDCWVFAWDNLKYDPRCDS